MTRPTSSTATTSRTATSARVEVDVDDRDGRRPAIRRVCVAGVRLVVEMHARVRLEPLVDPRRAVRRGIVAVDVGERRARRDAPRRRARSRRAAVTSRPPTTIAVRDATVGPESGTSAVSGRAISTASYGTPSSAATSWGRIVDGPLAHLGVATRTTIRPSAVSSSDATEASFSSPSR